MSFISAGNSPSFFFFSCRKSFFPAPQDLQELLLLRCQGNRLSLQCRTVFSGPVSQNFHVFVLPKANAPTYPTFLGVFPAGTVFAFGGGVGVNYTCFYHPVFQAHHIQLLFSKQSSRFLRTFYADMRSGRVHWIWIFNLLLLGNWEKIIYFCS